MYSFGSTVAPPFLSDLRSGPSDIISIPNGDNCWSSEYAKSLIRGQIWVFISSVDIVNDPIPPIPPEESKSID